MTWSFPKVIGKPSLNRGITPGLLSEGFHPQDPKVSRSSLRRICGIWGAATLALHRLRRPKRGVGHQLCRSKEKPKFLPRSFPRLRKLLQTVEHTYQGKPKGITPAFITSEGGKGPSFIELKVRDILNQCPGIPEDLRSPPPVPGFFPNDFRRYPRGGG
jgi:hypothetical protein